MATWQDVRTVAAQLPELEERAVRGAAQWRVRDGLVAWERPLRRADLEAIGAREQPGPVLAIRVPDVGVRAALITDAPATFFMTPHFERSSTVLAWLDRLSVGDLEELLTDAWLVRAPKTLANAYRQRLR